MGGYTLLTAIAVLAVIAAELLFFRTGVFRTAQYWITMAIVFAFQIPVDGWLTRLRAPVVIYNDDENLGIRWPWDIPIEDFGFGFAMVTLAILIWRRTTAKRGPAGAETAPPEPATQQTTQQTERTTTQETTTQETTKERG